MRVLVRTCGGSEVATLDAELSWRKEDVLAVLPRIAWGSSLGCILYFPPNVNYCCTELFFVKVFCSQICRMALVFFLIEVGVPSSVKIWYMRESLPDPSCVQPYTGYEISKYV